MLGQHNNTLRRIFKGQRCLALTHFGAKKAPTLLALENTTLFISPSIDHDGWAVLHLEIGIRKSDRGTRNATACHQRVGAGETGVALLEIGSNGPTTPFDVVRGEDLRGRMWPEWVVDERAEISEAPSRSLDRVAIGTRNPGSRKGMKPGMACQRSEGARVGKAPEYTSRQGRSVVRNTLRVVVRIALAKSTQQ